MALLNVENLTFAYPGGPACLGGISLEIPAGGFVVLCGPSGCGKTTLLRQMKTALRPKGTVRGGVTFDGRPLDGVDRREQTERIAFVGQRPGSQIVTDKVWHELAFGLESLGLDNREIRLRIAETASYFGIQDWFHRPVGELSGGQLQLLNLAAALVTGPDLLLLDEPTAQLDPIAARSFLDTLVRINRELGTAILLSEHRLEEAAPLADTLAVMDRGRLVACAPPGEAVRRLAELGHPMLPAMPTAARIAAAAAGERGELPLTPNGGRRWLEGYLAGHAPAETAFPDPPEPGGEVAVEARELWFAYGPEGPDVIRGLSLTVRTGELFAVVGGNGVGKTTALNLISGLLSPGRGRLRIYGKTTTGRVQPGVVGVLPQDPQLLFLRNTVAEELEEVLGDLHLSAGERAARRDRVVETCALAGLLDRHPYDLSGGEQQRAALAKVLLTLPRILLLDEPTKGLEQGYKDKLAGVLGRLRAGGMTIIMVSHDIEFCARYATRCALFFDGAVTAVGTPREMLSGNTFYTTAASRMAAGLIPGALTAEDILTACGIPELPVVEDDDGGPPAPPPTEEGPPPPGRRMGPSTVTAIVMLVLCIPLTIWLGVTRLGDRRYLLISLLVLLEAMLPFFVAFEGRKPRAREVVVIAVLCAIAVLGRTIFFMVPQFKPVAAVVIISGVALGGGAGFLVGAVSAIISNLFYGQGPWTPWQMLAFGLIGFLAGLLFHRRRPGRAALCVFGFFSVLVIYGGILNPASVIMFQPSPTPSMIAAYYLTGLPMDLVHAGSTAVFLLALSGPLLDKLERVKWKYEI